MVNEEHYARLKEGVQAWNEWRNKNANINLDFSYTDLSYTDLSRFDLSEVNLRRANVSRANLRWANLSYTDLSGANLNHTDLSYTDFTGANLSRANLSYTDLSGANLNHTDLSYTDLTGANLSGLDLRHTDITGANLSGLNLSKLDLDLSGVNFSEVNFSGVNLSGLDLSTANLSGANLSNAKLSGFDPFLFNIDEEIFYEQHSQRTILSGSNLSKANLSGLDLRKFDLSGTKLSGANFSRANLSRLDLSEFDLSGANFSGADLSKTQALGTDFTGATFTGACLEDWNINSATKLHNIDCQYVYLKRDKQERRPSSGEYAPGEFTKLFQKVQETVDLIFADGIDWKAFLLSFQELQAEYGEENLSVQAIEKKSGGAFVIRLEVPPESNKADVERQAKELYEIKLNALETIYHTKLKAKDEQIASYLRENATLNNVINTLGNRPIQNIINVTATSESKSMSEGSKQQFNNDLRNAQFAGGLVNADKVEAGQIGGNINNYTPKQRQNLAEAAAEIQQLLQQLEQTNPTTTNFEKTMVVAKAVDEIEKNPTLKTRVIEALKSGGKEALKELIDHPLVNILMASIEGWQEAD